MARAAVALVSVLSLVTSLVLRMLQPASSQYLTLFQKNGFLGPPLASSYHGGQYIWHNGYASAFVKSKRNTPLDAAWQGRSMALFYWLDANEYMGQRVVVSATLNFRNVAGEAGGGWAGVFARLDALDGSVMDFDNMANRRVLTTGEFQVQVEVEVPGVPTNSGFCLGRNRTPHRIAVGTFLVGRGNLITHQAWVSRVPLATGRKVVPSAWINPCLSDLGEGSFVNPLPYQAYADEG